MYQLEFDHIINHERGATTVNTEFAEIVEAPATWDSLLARAAAIALASRANQHITAFDLLLRDLGAMRDFMQTEFSVHPEELLE